MDDVRVQGRSRTPWLAGGWFAGDVLAPLAEVNTQCLDLLCAMAHAGDGLPPMLAAQAHAWRLLTPGARARLAASPFLLVDAAFGNEAHWQAVATHAVRDLPAGTGGPAFRGPAARAFIRRVLVYSWHLARSHRQVARLVLGLTPGTAALLAGLRLHDLDWLVDQHPGWIRPRWECRPTIWRHLLQAAAEGDRAQLVQASLCGIQLLAAGCLPPAPGRRLARERHRG